MGSSFRSMNWFFTPPVHTWTIVEADNVVALAVFLLVVDGLPAREPAVAAVGRRGEARAEAEAIAAVAGNLVDAEQRARGRRRAPALDLRPRRGGRAATRRRTAT